MGEQIRKDEDMKVMLEDGAYMPERGHETDAGIDLKAMHGQRVMPHSSAVFHTVVHVELPKGTAGLLVSKSGLNVKKDIVSTGLIDEAYRGEIVVKRYKRVVEQLTKFLVLLALCSERVKGIGKVI